jgi:hypothetical protein
MEERKRLINEILSLRKKYECLDIHDRKGITGYIDFIELNEIVSPVSYGQDVYGRPFVCMCVDIVYTDNVTIPTFTTIFKRYSEECSTVYHACGMYRKLFVTDGGMNIPQFTLVRDLLKNGSVEFDENTSDESIERLRLLNYCCSENDRVIHVSFEYKRPLRLVVSFNENDEMYK